MHRITALKELYDEAMEEATNEDEEKEAQKYLKVNLMIVDSSSEAEWIAIGKLLNDTSDAYHHLDSLARLQVVRRFVQFVPGAQKKRKPKHLRDVVSDRLNLKPDYCRLIIKLAFGLKVSHALLSLSIHCFMSL